MRFHERPSARDELISHQMRLPNQVMVDPTPTITSYCMYNSLDQIKWAVGYLPGRALQKSKLALHNRLVKDRKKENQAGLLEADAVISRWSTVCSLISVGCSACWH